LGPFPSGKGRRRGEVFVRVELVRADDLGQSTLPSLENTIPFPFYLGLQYQFQHHLLFYYADGKMNQTLYNHNVGQFPNIY
jgi:hypothetical protein